MRLRVPLIGAALLTGLVACTAQPAGAPGTPAQAPAAAGDVAAVGVKIGQSSLGPILTDQDGRTLYAFADDKGGVSTCTDDCAATWPALTNDKPFVAGQGTDQNLLSEVNRTEGTEQATYNQWPLYYYVGDQAPGDIDGQNVDGVWFVVGADGALIKNTP